METTHLTDSELSRWHAMCREQRQIARTWPAFDARMCDCEEYSFRLGPWSINLTLETFKGPPQWHASVAVLDTVGWVPVPGLKGIEVPQDALLAVESWSKEHYTQARQLLGDVLGPEIKTREQMVEETKGLWSLHWRTDKE